MSQAKQLPIATPLGEQTDQSALQAPPGQEVAFKSTSSTLPIRQRARTLAEVQPNPTTAAESSTKTTMEGAPDTTSKPLFQSFARRSPTQAEIKAAEEIEYEEVARRWRELEEEEEEGKYAASTLSPTTAIRASDYDAVMFEILDDDRVDECMASSGHVGADVHEECMMEDAEEEGMMEDTEEGGSDEEAYRYRHPELTEEELRYFEVALGICEEDEYEKENIAPIVNG
ncbi:MAG: hypothetical protein L6R36_005988 [Xanthoria steineri]|nr:MAG: hypothetical protein L6R36_005988 [Xanthoria steineri]